MSPAEIQLLNNHDALKASMPKDALAALRAHAMEAVEAHGLPGNAFENWKYTGTREIIQGEFAFPVAAPDIALEGVQRFDLDCDRMVFVNGVLDTRLSDAVDGYTVLPLRDALETHADTIRQAIAREYSTDDIAANGFTALNAAISRDGLLVAVPKNVEAARPLHLIFMSVPGASPSQAHPRVVVDLQDNACLSIVESHVGVDESGNLLNIASDVSVGVGAKLEHIKLVEGMTTDRQIANTRVSIAKDGNYTRHDISLGHRQVRNDLHVRLNDAGAHTELNGLFVVGGNQHVDNHLLVEHLAPHTTSNQVYRGVADDRGRGVFNGKVYVAKDAQKIEANQASNNLLLAKLAEIDTKPELEIYADDVKCSHGATIGQLDRNMLFYLQSRGIDAETARALLIFAFVDEIVHKIPYASISSHLEAQLVGRLPDPDVVKSFLVEDGDAA